MSPSTRSDLDKGIESYNKEEFRNYRRSLKKKIQEKK